ncbi:MAG: cell division protein FtsQ/DivIB [Fimbriimonadaceae bacterium]
MKLFSWILILALAGVLVAALYSSPVLAPRKVQVTGATELDKARIQRILGEQSGVPMLAWNLALIESRLQSNHAIRQSNVKRGWFDPPKVTIEYREPVARVVGGKDAFLSQDGTIFSQAGIERELPRVYLPSPAFEPSVTILGNWDLRSLAAVATALSDPPSERIQLALDGRGVLKILVPDFGPVDFGTLTSIEEKLQTLDRIRTTQPKLLQPGEMLNIMAPDKPVVSQDLNYNNSEPVGS